MTKPELMRRRATRLALLLAAALIPASVAALAAEMSGVDADTQRRADTPSASSRSECARGSGAGRRSSLRINLPLRRNARRAPIRFGQSRWRRCRAPANGRSSLRRAGRRHHPPSRLCRLRNHRHRRRRRHGSSVRSFRWSAPLSPMTIRALGFLSIRQRMRGCA